MTREEYDKRHKALFATRAALMRMDPLEGDLIPTGEAMLFGALMLIADCIRDLVEVKS